MADATTPSQRAPRPESPPEGGRGALPSEAKSCLLRLEPEQPWHRIVLRRELTALGVFELRRGWHESDSDRVLLEPRGGSGLVQVNGEPVQRARELADRDTISVGETTYRFHQAGGIRHLIRCEDVLARATDPTSGCLRRSVLRDHLAQLHEDAVEGGHPISIALFGVDDWAKIEERFEPAARGVIIARVAQVMGDGLRQTDLLFGNREHEFALVLPGTTADSLYGLGERMLRRVEEEPIDTEQGTCLITVSVGLLTGLDPRLHPGPDEFLAEAEALLDHGMHGGPSRIIA